MSAPLRLVAVWRPQAREVALFGEDFQVALSEAEAEALAGAIRGALATRDHGDNLTRLHAAGFSGDAA